MSLAPNRTVGKLLASAATAGIRRAILQAGCPDLLAAVAKVERRPAQLRTYSIDDAMSIVTEITSAEALTSIHAREKRVGVHEALQANKHTPEGLQWGVPRANYESIPTNIENVADLLGWLERNPAGYSHHGFLEWLVTQSPNRKTFLELYAQGRFGSVSPDIFFVLQDHEDTMSVETFHGLLGRRFRYRFSRALEADQEIGVPLVLLGLKLNVIFSYTGRYTPDALEVLRASPRNIDRGLTLVVDPQDVEVDLETYTSLPASAQALVLVHATSLAHQQAYAEALTYDPNSTQHDSDPAELLNSSHRYTLQGRINLLRWASSSEIAEHLLNEHYTPEDLDKILFMLHSDLPRYTSVSDWVQELSGHNETDSPRLKELVRYSLLHAPGLVPLALDARVYPSERMLYAHILAQIQTYCGEDPQRWESVLTLGPAWEGTVDELVELIGLTHA